MGQQPVSAAEKPREGGKVRGSCTGEVSAHQEFGASGFCLHGEELA